VENPSYSGRSLLRGENDLLRDNGKNIGITNAIGIRE